MFVLRGGTVIDGTGGARYAADVRVQDGLITEIGPALAARVEHMWDRVFRLLSARPGA